MTPTELTAALVRKLLADVSVDVEVLEQLAKRVEEADGQVADSKWDAAARAFLAVQLHNYYCALEKMLRRVLRTVDGVVPTGESWHRELIEQACRPVPRVRPAVFGNALAGELDRLRAFRHFFRNAYAVELDWAELEGHRRRVSLVHPSLVAEVGRLLQHLEATLDLMES